MINKKGGVFMKSLIKKTVSYLLSVLLVLSCIPVISVYADSALEIFDESGVQITEKQYLTEYDTMQLQALVPTTAEDGTVSGTAVDTSDGSYIKWESNLPLLANVDDNGEVTAYDFSKTAIIQLWIDENIRSLPLVGDTTADAIWAAFESSGIDFDSASTDTIVGIVTGLAGETLGESLRTYLDNMNVVITATLYDVDGNVLGSDSVEFVIEKSTLASLMPTGVHITNKRTVPTTVAVGSTVQLYGACTPVRLEQEIKWSVGENILDTDASDYAQVSSDGLVTFLAVGQVTVRVNPESTLYATFSETITFTVVEQSELPITSFEISGETSVAENGTIQLAVDNVEPAGAYKGGLVWSSADPTIATIDQSGVVTGLNGGDGLTYSQTVIITATMGGVSKDIEITVTRPIVSSLTGITIAGDAVLGIGATSGYTSTVAPSRLNTSSSVSREWGVYDDDTDAVIYATSGVPATNGIVSVDSNGNVTGVSSGVAKLYAKATYGSSSVENYIEITCGNAITDFTINGTTSISEGNTTQLSISVLAPTDYEASLLDAIKWSVADDSIASVSQTGLVLGRDAGGRNSSKTTTVYATISGVTRSVTITVSRGWLNLSKYTDGQIEGDKYVIRDIPHGFTLKTYPESLSQSASYWAIEKDDGSAPWSVSNTYTGSNRNTENEYASVSDDGIVTGKKTGTTTLYGFSRYLLQTHVERTKEIEIIEILPESITLKAPDKTEYIEGETELDLTGMEVYLNYNKEDLAPYYSDWESYTVDQLKCQVTDYKVSGLNSKIVDTPQYIIVSVERAGKTYNAVFTVTLNSKQVDSITITPPDKTVYVEGEDFNSTGIKVVANYLNAESEEVTGFEIDETSFSMETYDVRQNVRVVYEHADRIAEATFSIIVYGKPVISVEVDGIIGEWTTEDVSFTFDSTHQLAGATYYYRQSDSEIWRAIQGNTFVISQDTNETYCFKAVNSLSYESAESEAYVVKLDKTTPTFTLRQSVTDITNQDYAINFDDLSYSVSGIESITVNGIKIGADAVDFIVSRNDIYVVKITANNGLFSEDSIEINNIDKEVPGITDIVLTQEPADSPERHLEGEFGNYYSADLVATATGEDSGVAGVDYIKYRLVSEDYTPATGWVVVTEEARAICDSNFKGYFEFVAVDRAGNESSSYYSDGFVRDSAKPVITTLNAICGEDGYEYTSDIWADDIIYFTPEADTFSGVYQYYYNIDGGDWQELTTETLRAREDGSFVYGFKALSYSGLESDVYKFNVNIDRTVPTIRVEFEGTFGQWTKDDVTFTLSTLVDCPSGCTYYYNDGTGWNELDGNVLVLDESTNAYYSFKAVNGAGLESAPSDSYKVMIDNVEPSGYIIPGVTEKTDAPYDVAIVPVAGESGYLKIYFNGEDVTESLKATVSSNGSYALTVIGNNMLSSTVMIDITNFNVIPESLFSYEEIDGEILTITSYNGSAANVTVPLEIDSLETKSLSENAFLNKISVVSVNIPNTVETIGVGCFSGCENLSKVIIPESVVEIADDSFDGCDNLTIYCYEGSYAQIYAEEKGIPYVLLDLVPVGKTVINEEAGIIFTQQTVKTAVEEIVKSDSNYTVMAIPSFATTNVNYYGTGSVLYFFRNGSLVFTYNVVVYGDVNGDSAVDVLDAAMVRLASSDLRTLEGNYFLATDFTNDGAIDVSDYQQVINICLK